MSKLGLNFGQWTLLVGATKFEGFYDVSGVKLSFSRAHIIYSVSCTVNAFTERQRGSTEDNLGWSHWVEKIPNFGNLEVLK